VDEAEKVLDVVLPSGDEATDGPCEESLHPPALAVAAQLAAILTPDSAFPTRADVEPRA
jgi:hypothetical protein